MWSPGADEVAILTYFYRGGIAAGLFLVIPPENTTAWAAYLAGPVGS